MWRIGDAGVGALLVAETVLLVMNPFALVRVIGVLVGSVMIAGAATIARFPRQRGCARRMCVLGLLLVLHVAVAATSFLAAGAGTDNGVYATPICIGDWPILSPLGPARDATWVCASTMPLGRAADEWFADVLWMYPVVPVLRVYPWLNMVVLGTMILNVVCWAAPIVRAACAMADKQK